MQALHDKSCCLGNTQHRVHSQDQLPIVALCPDWDACSARHTMTDADSLKLLAILKGREHDTCQRTEAEPLMNYFSL